MQQGGFRFRVSAEHFFECVQRPDWWHTSLKHIFNSTSFQSCTLPQNNTFSAWLWLCCLTWMSCLCTLLDTNINLASLRYTRMQHAVSCSAFGWCQPRVLPSQTLVALIDVLRVYIMTKDVSSFCFLALSKHFFSRSCCVSCKRI